MTRNLSHFTVYLVGHAHIDLGYRWRWNETVHRIARDTFRGVLRMMEAVPEFTFVQSQLALYEAMKQHYPDLLTEIKARIAEGRWIVADGWCEYDQTMPGGESIIRQHLIGSRYAKEELGCQVTMAWAPDAFSGHVHTLPAILKGCGIEHFLYGRGVPDDAGPYFWWEGPDGSRVLAYSPAYGYSADLGPRVLEVIERWQALTGDDEMLFLYGRGDHGGGPREGDFEALEALRQEADAPRFVHATPQFYFREVLGTKADLRVYRGELGGDFTGSCSSVGRAKQRNRQMENLILTAERFATLAMFLQRKPSYPRVDFEDAWRTILEHQFHDELPGTSVAGVYLDNEADYERVERLLSDTLNASLTEIAARLDTRGEGRDGKSVPLVVYNPLAWTRSELVRVTLRLNAPPAGPRGEGLAIRNTDGHEMPTQVFAVRQQAPYWYAEVGFLARDVPSLGYRVFWAEPVERPEPEAELLASSLAAAEQWSLSTGEPLASSLAEAEGLSLSTDDTMRAYLREIERVPGLDFADELWLTMRISTAPYIHTLLDEPPAPADGGADLDATAHWAAVAHNLVANAYDAFLENWEELAKVCKPLAIPMPDLSRILHDVSRLSQDVGQVQYLVQYVDAAEIDGAAVVGDGEQDQDRRKALRGSLFTVYRALYVIPPATLAQLLNDYEQHLALPPRRAFLARRVNVDDVVQHVRAILDDARDAREALIRGNLRLVVDVAKRYGHGILPLDLIQAGNTGLVRAVDRYDYTRGYPFRAYAEWWIRQAISHAISQATAGLARTISIPPDTQGIGFGTAIAVRESVDAITLENTFLRVQVSRQSGHVAQVWDKRGQREALSGPGNVLQAVAEIPHEGTAWVLALSDEMDELDRPESVEVAQRGPVQAAVRVAYRYRDSYFVQTISLSAGSPLVEFRLQTHWYECDRCLKVAFPAAVEEGEATFEAPLGSIVRPADGSEVPALRWIDVSNGDYGVSLLNDCRYAFDVRVPQNVRGTRLRMTLLRGFPDMSPEADAGEHDLRYALYPHPGGWRDADTVRRGWAFNMPLIARQALRRAGVIAPWVAQGINHAMPPAFAFLNVEPENVVLVACKLEDETWGPGSPVIVRLYETAGVATEARIVFAAPLMMLEETNHLEERIESQAFDAREARDNEAQVTVRFRPHEIKTFRLRLAIPAFAIYAGADHRDDITPGAVPGFGDG